MLPGDPRRAAGVSRVLLIIGAAVGLTGVLSPELPGAGGLSVRETQAPSPDPATEVELDYQADDDGRDDPQTPLSAVRIQRA
jgi:hypothetical protein